MTEAEFRTSVAADIREYMAIGERPTQPRDCGVETEAEERMRCIEEWDLQVAKMRDFLQDRPDLMDAIALAAIALDSLQTGLAKQEFTRAIDAAREAYIERRTRVAA